MLARQRQRRATQLRVAKPGDGGRIRDEDGQSRARLDFDHQSPLGQRSLERGLAASRLPPNAHAAVTP